MNKVQQNGDSLLCSTYLITDFVKAGTRSGVLHAITYPWVVMEETSRRDKFLLSIKTQRSMPDNCMEVFETHAFE